jgi:hypothetical protein
MHTTIPASLDSAALARRLGELAGHERELQLEFLVHLGEYDRRRAYADAGYSSLWDYMMRALHYREGATHRRICAMRAVRRLPEVGEAVRDGRLCLTTLALLEPVLTPENAGDLVVRAAFKSKAEVERIVASIHPRAAPKDGVKRIARHDSTPAPVELANAPAQVETKPAASMNGRSRTNEVPLVARAVLSLDENASAPATPPTIKAVSADDYSLRVTIDGELKRELDELRALLSHKVPNGDLRAVLREAVRCAIEKHGKRKGAVQPTRHMKKGPAATTEPHLDARRPTAELRRQIWNRDGGRCAWTAPDGRRCGSTWQLEVDHVDAAALGGLATLENCRLLCRTHNLAHAEATYGREHMDLFRRASPP